MNPLLADIVQPGNVKMIVGGLVIGALGVAFAASAPASRRGTALLLCLLYGVPAVGLLIHGGHRYLSSRDGRSLDEPGFTAPAPAAPEPATETSRQRSAHPPTEEEAVAPEAQATRDVAAFRPRVAGRASRRGTPRHYFSTDPRP